MSKMRLFFCFLNYFLAIGEFQCILMLHTSMACFLSSQINFICMMIMLLLQKFILSPFVLKFIPYFRIQLLINFIATWIIEKLIMV
jgi:hypothetical protein